MSENLYELKNKSVQEIMSTPPHKLIIIGIAFTVVLLFCTLYFLGTIYVTNKLRIPVEIRNISTLALNPYTKQLTLSTNTYLPVQYVKQDSVQFSFDRISQMQDKIFKGKIIDLFQTKYHQAVFIINTNSPAPLNKGMIGVIEYNTSSETYLSLFFHKIKR